MKLPFFLRGHTPSQALKAVDKMPEVLVDPVKSDGGPQAMQTIQIPLLTKDFSISNHGDYSPHLNVLDRKDVFALIRGEAGPGKTFLDVGGRDGERRTLAEGLVYRIMDLAPGIPDAIKGDICQCPDIADDSFDVVFSMNLLEHVADPWAAAAEMTRIACPGGLLMHLAPFAWRYHPYPEDYWRFSHTGLKMLFERTGRVSTLLSGYDIQMRRKDQRGGALPDNLDVPPVDQLGGWREHWHAIWVGRKLSE
jgi:SAM-dependent methyltransferase